MRIAIRRFLLTATVLGLMVGAAGRAQAAITLTATEVEGNVVLTGGGTVNLADLTRFVSALSASAIAPSVPLVLTGPPSGMVIEVYGSLSGPADFGPGGVTIATSGTGDRFGISVGILSPVLAVPLGYTSGTPLSTTSTFANATFASLGLTPGTYVWTWGAGANADSLTLQIGPADPVDLIRALIEQVEGSNLPQGIKNSFVAKLEAALAALEAGDTAAACDSVQAFINHAEAQSGKKLPAADAAVLIRDAREIRQDLGCS